MKRFVQSSIWLLFFIFNNPIAHAVVEIHPSNSATENVIPPQYKPTFLQKISLEIAKKRLKKHFKTTNLSGTKTVGDKIAAYGIWAIIGSLALFVLALLISPNSAFLGISILFLQFSGLLASIAALTRKDLSKKGKTMALWGVGIVAFELMLVILTLVLAYFSY